MNEDSFQAKIKARFLNEAMGKECRFWQKIHGSHFQVGLPDIVVSTPGGSAWVELKWLKKSDLEVSVCEVSSRRLATGQRVMLRDLHRADGPLKARVLYGWADELGQMHAVGCDWSVASTTLGTMSIKDMEQRSALNGGDFNLASHSALRKLTLTGDWRADFLLGVN